MGQRISYYRNNFKKELQDIIFENFSAFRQWYLETEKSSMDEFGEPFGNEMLIAYLKENPDFEIDFSRLNKKLIDELTAEFIGSYCDLTDTEGTILELFGPAYNKWRYNSGTEMVLKTKDADFIRLWNFVIKGRSLSDGQDFDSFTNDYKIGFLTFSEQRVLKAKIEIHFGNIEQIKRKYWTGQEKLAERKAIENSKNGTYVLSGHHPKSSGVECVLQVLNEIAADESGLITAIDTDNS
jgi:hypothetical protein